MGNIEIINETTYSLGSADNQRKYLQEIDLADGYRPSSVHGVVIGGKPTAVFGASGGATGVHEHSLLQHGGHSYLAVGPYIVCFNHSPFKYNWAMLADQATCFGVYYNRGANALISHGELEISRFSESGQILWSASGADIFTEGFELLADFVQATDFNGKIYCFDYSSGRVRV